jgi:hypothetical protein
VINIDNWLVNAILAVVKEVGECTLPFLVDYLDFTTKEKEWTDLSDKTRAKLVSFKVRGLVKGKKLMKIGRGYDFHPEFHF